MKPIRSSIAELFSLAHSKISRDIDKQFPVQNYIMALKSVREADLSRLKHLLSEANFTQAQLSELLIHAAYITNYEFSKLLIEHGANIAYDNYRAWRVALETGNTYVVKYLKSIVNTDDRRGRKLYLVV